MVMDAGDAAFAQRDTCAADLACSTTVFKAADGAVTVAVVFNFTGGVVFDPVGFGVVPAKAAAGLAQDVGVGVLIDTGGEFGVVGAATGDDSNGAVEAVVGEAKRQPVGVGVPLAVDEAALDRDRPAPDFDAVVDHGVDVGDGIGGDDDSLGLGWEGEDREQDEEQESCTDVMQTQSNTNRSGVGALGSVRVDWNRLGH